MRRFFWPNLRRPLPVFLTPTANLLWRNFVSGLDLGGNWVKLPQAAAILQGGERLNPFRPPLAGVISFCEPLLTG
jgi:hypothetical protein